KQGAMIMRPLSKTFVIAAIASLCVTGLTFGGQDYELPWSTIDGGGGTSAGGGFTLSGTVGQCDAQTPPIMTGGAFVLAGGFWPGLAAVCAMPGDVNFDGHVDGRDVQLFVNCITSGSGNCICADMDS